MAFLCRFGIAIFVIALSSCAEIQRPTVEPFFAVTVPPPKQELRWSNGKMPKSLDPARAAAAPETDLIRAVYDGLTDLDSKNLKAIPGVAEKWEASEDKRIWTFTLRKDARWSNGDRVTAADFVRSWKRLIAIRDKTANSFLFQNIAGMQDKDASSEPSDLPGDFLHSMPPDGTPEILPENIEPLVPPRSQLSAQNANNSSTLLPVQTEILKPQRLPANKFGAEALNDSTLRVSLVLPDKDFPNLVANPIFRPVFGDGSIFERERLDPATVTNGAFRFSRIAADGITLERSDTHWNRQSVALESVRFVAAASPEKALDAYKKGEVDVVTNAAFEPLALKILTPYEDFRRTAHSALNFYEFNTAKAPYSDRRIREALAISIDRTKLTEGDLEGLMQPATTFFPIHERKSEALALDVAKAKQLMDKAGYPDGTNFPAIRLVVNRNDTQQRVARSIARMWKQNLNIETNIDVKEPSEIESLRLSGDFDLLRRGVVLPSNDEIVNLVSIFGSAKKIVGLPAETKPSVADDPAQSPVRGGPFDDTKPDDPVGGQTLVNESEVLTEEDVIFDLRAIPLYFPTSYALIKPYVRGFEMNGLDAPSLKEISIDSSWQPRVTRSEQ
jgi:oligopeptide transport system substrate-binding protein